MSVREVSFKPFSDQKPGTSGLRKKVAIFQQPHYSESFITSILLSIPEGVEGSFLVIGGDGRYYNPEVMRVITNAVRWAAPMDGPAPKFGHWKNEEPI